MIRISTILSLTLSLLCTQITLLYADTSKDTVIKHSTDAVLDDWDPSAFDIHEATGIRMAVDNDANKMYMALYIVNQDLQKRIMLGGMQLLVDTKAKKRDNSWIEFPLQKTPQEIAQYLTQQTAEKSGTDVLSFREQMAGGMLFLKKMGFNGQQYETELQAINLFTDINLSFGWDERSVMYIEYEIPFTRLGGREVLLNKPVSVGLKLNAVDLPVSAKQPIRTETKVIAVPMGSGAPSSAAFGTSSTGFRTNHPINKSAIPEQTFWLKHQIY